MTSEATYRDLPAEVLEKLRALELELEEGDITKKGYEKKKANLLQEYASTDDSTNGAVTPRGDTNNSWQASETPNESATTPIDLEPEPSAADVVDFLDYLPSPTHSPTRSGRGAELMEENSQRLQQQRQQQLDNNDSYMTNTAPSNVNNMPALGSPSQQPRTPSPQQQWQPQPQPPPHGQMTYPFTGPVRPPLGNPYQPAPNWQYDQRMMPRPQNSLSSMHPQSPNAYGPYNGQPRPYAPIYNRPAPPPPPTAGPIYASPRPMYNTLQRPMPGPQQAAGPPRPVYSPGMTSPRPAVGGYGGPRPPPHVTPVPLTTTTSSSSHGHGRTSSLDSRSEANSVMQANNVKQVYGGYHVASGAETGQSDLQAQAISRNDEWETASVSSNWRPPPGRAPSIVSSSGVAKPIRSSTSSFALMDGNQATPVMRRSLRIGRSRYSNSYMATSFKAVESAPIPQIMLEDPVEQMRIADLAGRQLLPLEPREIPFRVVDSGDHLDMNDFSNLAEILRYRGTRSSNARATAFTVVDARGKETVSLTWEKLNARAEKIAHVIREKSGLHTGDRVALIYRKSEQLEFIIALLGCFLAGMVAVPINAAEELAELSFILSLTNAYLVLTTDFNLRAFTKDMQARSIEFPSNIEWWKTNDFGSWYPKKMGSYPPITVPDLAYIEYAKAPNGELKGVAVNHSTVMSSCRTFMAGVTETEVSTDESGEYTITPKYNARGTDCIVTYLEQRQQLGLIISVLYSIFSGSHTVFASSSIVDTPAVWIYVLSKFHATIALADYSSLNYITKYYQAHTKEVQQQSKKVAPDLSKLRFLMIDTVVVRPDMNDFIANCLLKPLGNRTPLETVCPVASLPEHGGAILSFRDFAGPARLGQHPDITQDPQMQRPRSIYATGNSRDVWECLLDAESLKMNKVVVLATGEEVRESQGHLEPGKTRVGSFGFVAPEATVAIVDPDTGTLCPPDTIGEVWIDMPSLSGGFWGLPKHTETVFHARPVIVPPETMHPETYDQEFLRTGLVGTLIGGRLVVFGTYEERIRQQRLGESFGVEEVHFANDIVETAKKHAGVEQCTVLEVPVNDQHMPVFICESSMARSELPKFVETILDTLLTYHGLRVYSVIILAPNSMSRHTVHGRRRIHPLMVKHAFLTGQMNIRYLKFDVDRTVFNLASREDLGVGFWRSFVAYEKAVRSGQIMPRSQHQHTGMETVRAVIDERTDYDLSSFTNIVDILLWRTRLYAEEIAFVAVTQASNASNINTKPYTWRKINNKIAGVANYLMKRGFKRGRKALVLLPFGIDWIEAIYACMVLGVIPVPFEPPDPIQHPQRVTEDVLGMAATVKDLNIDYIIVNSQSDDVMSNKHVVAALKQAKNLYRGSKFALPEFTNISKASKTSKMLGNESGLYVKPEWFTTGENHPALISVHFTPDGQRFYVSLGHETILAQCRAQKMTCQLKSQRSIVGSGIGAYDGLGLLHYAFCGVYVGSPTVLLPVSDFYVFPSGYFELLQRYKAKDVCASHPLLQYAMNRISPSEQRSISLASVQNLMLVTEGRPKPALYQHMLRHFGPSRLEKEAINTVYSNMCNPMVTTRSYMLIEPISLLVDFGWLRQGIVRPLPPEAGEAQGLVLHDSGIVPSNTMVAIVNPETHTICPSNVVGEIWVASDCNVRTIYGLSEAAHNAKFDATIVGGDPRVKYMRTGDLGFLWNVQRRVDRMQPIVEEGQCLFVLGPMDEVIERNGLIHFPYDIELSVERNCPGIVPGGCIVFQIGEEIVVVAATKSKEQALAAVSLIVGVVLDEHSVLVDTVVIVNSSQLPRSRYGEKQRRKTMMAFKEKTLPAIYVNRITNQHEPLQLPQYTQSQFGLDNDAMSVVSMQGRSNGAPSIAENTDLDRSGDSVHSNLKRNDTASTRQSFKRQSSGTASPAITPLSEQ